MLLNTYTNLSFFSTFKEQNFSSFFHHLKTNPTSNQQLIYTSIQRVIITPATKI